MSETSEMRPVLLRGPHGDRLLVGLGQKERGTLGALVASGRIGSAELLAANRWYEAFAMAEHGAFDNEKAGGNSRTKLYAQERLLAATTSYREARRAIGKAGDGRLRAVLGDGLSMAALAERMKQDRKMVAGMVVADLVRLVEHYTASDRTTKGKAFRR